MGEIKNIVFDIGNVVIRWEPYAALKDFYSDPEEMNMHLTEIGFFEWNIEQDRGRSIADGLNQAKRNGHHAHIFEAYINGLHLSHRNQVPGTAHIIRNLAANSVPIYGLSNITEAAYGIVLETAPELKLLRHTTVSARVGMVKPEPEIFEYCLEENNLVADETLFVDDSIANCKTAERLGLHAHHFRDAAKLNRHLTSLGFL